MSEYFSNFALKMRTGAEKPTILLSFDTEEFDVPREQGVDIALDEAMRVSVAGTERFIDIVEQCGARATFFCTATFAAHAPQVMQRIMDGGHEVASHGVDHWQPQPSDPERSKQLLEQQCGVPIHGYRQPRMFAVDHSTLARAGYCYNSSLHPTFIPGRYMHLNVPRTPFFEGEVLQIPASVTPWVRIPVFWLACHHYPQWLYRRLCLWTARHDGQFVVYFHPWEFFPLAQHPEWRIPYLMRHNSGEAMARRLCALLEMFGRQDTTFATYSEFTSQFQATHPQP